MSSRRRPTQRSACDRCHGQKLRCIRGPHPNNSCQRCIKARETCHSSPPLRLGRRANKSEVENGPEGDSAASSSQNGTTACTDGPERQSEEGAPRNFPQLGFHGGDIALPVQEDAQDFEDYDPLVFAARTVVFPEIPEPNQPQQESHTGPSNSNAGSSNFNIDNYNNSHIIDVADVSNNTRGSSWKDLPVDTFLATPPTETETPVQPSAPNDAQRQLTELLGNLYADPYHSPVAFATSATSNSSNLNLHLMDVTVKAAHTLLGVIDSLQGSDTISATPNTYPFSDTTDVARGFVDAETGFLIAACYSRIFSNANALAVGLRNAVSSNDMSALCSMPSINMGSAIPLYTTSPVIQSSLWVQLLWQSMRELEKRLLTLSHSALPSPPTPEFAFRPLHRSHMHDLVNSVDADIAKLEVNVDNLLQTTLHILRHKSI